MQTEKGSQHHKAGNVFVAMKTDMLAIERKVKEKFALSLLNTSGCG